MKNSSRKAKGRYLQNIVKQKIMDLYPALTSDDVRTSMMSEAGADVKLTSAMARKLFPYSIECKNQEKLNLWSAWQQTQKNSSDFQPLLIVGKNKQRPLAVVDAEHYFELTGWKKHNA